MGVKSLMVFSVVDGCVFALRWSLLLCERARGQVPGAVRQCSSRRWCPSSSSPCVSSSRRLQRGYRESQGRGGRGVSCGPAGSVLRAAVPADSSRRSSAKQFVVLFLVVAMGRGLVSPLKVLFALFFEVSVRVFFEASLSVAIASLREKAGGASVVGLLGVCFALLCPRTSSRRNSAKQFVVLFLVVAMGRGLVSPLKVLFAQVVLFFRRVRACLLRGVSQRGYRESQGSGGRGMAGRA